MAGPWAAGVRWAAAGSRTACVPWAASVPWDRAAVAGGCVGRPVRRAVAAPRGLVGAAPCGLVRAAPRGLVRAPPRGLVPAAPCGLVGAPPCGLIRAAPRGVVRPRNRRRTVPWGLFAGHLRRIWAVWQPGARTATRGPPVLQIRIAHGASVFL